MSDEQITKSIAERRSDLCKKFDDLQTQRDNINTELRKMKRTMDDLEGDQQFYTDKLEEVEKSIEALSSEIYDKQSDDSKLEDQQMGIEDELALLKEVGN